jgi:hypothetical protein
VVSARLAILATPERAGLHGVDASCDWGEARTFGPGETAALGEWRPETVIALDVAAPSGPWRVIAWGAQGPRRVTTAGDAVWWRVPLPAADDLDTLRGQAGRGVVVAGGEKAGRQAAVEKLHARGVEAREVPVLTRGALQTARVVALLGTPGAPLPDAGPAVLAAGRVLVAPRAERAFGLLAWSDHLPYENEDELVCSADAADTYPDAFEAVLAMGALSAEAHRASAVYRRIAVDAELEDAARGR